MVGAHPEGISRSTPISKERDMFKSKKALIALAGAAVAAAGIFAGGLWRHTGSVSAQPQVTRVCGGFMEIATISGSPESFATIARAELEINGTNVNGFLQTQDGSRYNLSAQVIGSNINLAVQLQDNRYVFATGSAASGNISDCRGAMGGTGALETTRRLGLRPSTASPQNLVGWLLEFDEGN
jgi:hypothetical protein